MVYSLIISSKAEKELAKIPKQFYTKIIENIVALADDPRPHGYKKLKGRDGYRIRIGDYRVIYSIEDDKLIIRIITVGNRKEVYR